MESHRERPFPDRRPPASNDKPGLGTVITATNDHLTLTGFYFTRSGAEHGLIAYQR